MTKLRNFSEKACFLYVEGGCACARCLAAECGRKQLTTAPEDAGRLRNRSPGLPRETWTQMRLLRPPRVQRKHLYALAACVIIIFLYNQYLGYAILTEATGGKTSAKCDNPYQEAIDVVYTWVNGSEERFQREMHRHSGEDGARPDAYAPQRFHDKHELKYSLRSLEKHMPWARHVYIVTNGQIPSWLNLDHPRVTIVTHEEIFPDAEVYDVLPTFSSPAIEVNLHRIPGVSDKFIYFNDDVFLNADVFPEDFYTRNRGFKIYTAWGADCARKCEWSHISNGRCDAPCYNEDCDFDGGDCALNTTNLQAIQVEQINNGTKTNATYSDADYKSGLPSFLALANVTNTTDQTLAQRIQRFNAERMRSHKLMRFFQRERNVHHMRMMNRMVSKLFPSEVIEGDVEPEEHNEENTALRKDLYSSSLIFTQKLLGRMFGYRRRNVIAHAPLMIDRRIMAEVERVFPGEFSDTRRNKFRHVDNLQVAFVYSYYLSLVKNEKSMGEIFDEYDTDQSGTWSDREIHTLLTRVYPLPLKIEMVLEFQQVLNNCTNSLHMPEVDLEQVKSTMPKYERYVDSQLSVVTKRMIVQCDALKAVLNLHDTITHRGKYKHEFVEAAEHVSFNQLHSAAVAAMDMLNNIRRTPRKFVCINDDLDRTNATRLDDELLLTLLEDFFISLFPAPSSFELPPEFRNRYSRMEELRAWQQWRTPTAYLRYAVLTIITLFLIFACARTRFPVPFLRLRYGRYGRYVSMRRHIRMI